MSDRDIIRQLAERVMGWRICSLPFRTSACDNCKLFEYEDGFFFHNANGTRRKWDPLNSIADAFEMQAAIPEYSRESYNEALMQECGWKDFESFCEDWEVHRTIFLLISASPRARCLAALKAIGDTE